MRQREAGGFKRFGPEQKQFNSSDLDELRFVLRREVGQKFEIRGRNRPFSTSIQFRQLNDLRVSYTWFATPMVISLIPSDPYYSLYFSHSGSSDYRVPVRVFFTSPSCGAFVPGVHRVAVRTNENC